MPKSIHIAISSILFALWVPAVDGQPLNGDTLGFEVLLTNKMFSEIRVNEKFTNSLDITSNRHVLISTTDQFYVLGWGGIVPMGNRVAGDICSYAFTSDNLLMTIRNNELCVFDSLGNLSKLFELPSKGMGISAGKYVMYVYDRDENQHTNALYVIVKGGKYAKLFEVPAPIVSVVELDDLILFATGNGLFSFDVMNKELKALVALPQNIEVRSIALDTSNQRIYFSTDSAVCALINSNVEIITNKLGGILRYFDNGLMVFNPEKRLLIRMVGIENKVESVMKTEAKGKQISKVVSNTSIPFSTTVNHPFTIRPGKSTWEQLNASIWLSGKAGEAAKEGDLEEASFLIDQAYRVTIGTPLTVTVPSAPSVPASFGTPENVQVYESFVIAINEQTKKVIDATREVRVATTKHKEAEKTAAEKERQLEKIKSQSPRTSEKSQDDPKMIAAQKALEQSKQDLKDAEQGEETALQQKEQEEKMVTRLRSMYDKAKSGAIDMSRFRQVRK